jgi:peptidoglycan hydrolase-like protein with peptidoglycan-binding domain
MEKNRMNCENINLKRGSKGDTVKEVQKILKTRGYYTGKIDGDYGPLTETAVKKYQKTTKGLLIDGIVGPVTCKHLQTKETNTKTKLLQRFEKATKTTINDYKTLYNAFGKVKYILYYNDIYTQGQEITRIEKGQPLNCTDQAQLAMQLLLDLGYNKNQVRIVRGVVTCKNGKGYGHVWLQINIDGKGWKNYDPSAKSAHGYNMGALICTRGYHITNINPAWAVSDDGRT